MKLFVSPSILSHLRFYAAESYPLEVTGALIGNTVPDGLRVYAAVPFTVYDDRTPTTVTAEPIWSFEDLAHDLFPGLDILGGWHSHPNYLPSPSDEDKASIEDDDVEIIVSIWPGKRNIFRFQERAYYAAGGKRLSRVQIVTGEDA